MLLRVLSLIVVLGTVIIGCGATAPSRHRNVEVAAPPVRQAAPAGGQIRAEAVAADSDGFSLTSSGPSEPKKRVAAEDRRQAEVDQTERKLIKNAWLTLELDDEDDFEPAIEKINHVAEKLEGYATEQSKDSIEFKVPSGRLDEALTAVAALGDVTERDIKVVDVTARYVDLKIRIDNLVQMRKRLKELVEQGQNVKEILEVEKELNRITTQLEQMKGQMRLLNNQITYATVHVRIEESVVPGPVGWVFYGGYHVVKWLFIWD